MENKYKDIIKFIPLLEDKNIKWVNDEEHTYTNIGIELKNEITKLMFSEPNAYKVLDEYNATYEPLYKNTFDYDNCSKELAYAYLAIMVRKDKFNIGLFAGFINRGIVLKLIKVLEKCEE